MSTSPEAPTPETAEQAAGKDKPKFSPDQLRAENVAGEIRNVLRSYEISEPEDSEEADDTGDATPRRNDTELTPPEVDFRKTQAVRDGLFKEDPSRGPDDVFDGPKLVPTAEDVPAVKELLADYKDARENALYHEKLDEIDSQITQQEEGGKVDRLAYMLRDSLQNDEIDLTPASPGQPGRPERPPARGKPAIPATTDVPPTPSRLEAVNRRQMAVKRAFESAVAELSPEQQAEFEKIQNDIARRKGEIRKDAAERKSSAHKQAEDAQKARVEEARAQVAEARAAIKQDMDLGVNKETLREGTLVENPDQRAIDEGKVDENGVLLRDAQVTSSKLHEEALTANEEFDLRRQLGNEGYEKHKAEQVLLQEHPGVAAAYQRAHEAWEQSQQNGDGLPEPQVSDFGPSGRLRMSEVEAWTDSSRNDNEVRAQQEVYERYKPLIGNETDENKRQLLVAARDKAVGEAKAKVGSENAAGAERVAQAMTLADEMLARAGKHQSGVDVIRDNALADEVRKVLNLKALPDMETKIGGLGNGPKTVEAWYRVPGSDHAWVVERINRLTGERISQSRISSEGASRDRRGKQLPPKSAMEQVKTVRLQDIEELKKRPDARNDGSMGLRERVNFGFGIGGAVDGRDGAYSKFYQLYNPNLSEADAQIRYDQYSKAHRKLDSKIERAGGVRYWLQNIGQRQTPAFRQQKPKEKE